MLTISKDVLCILRDYVPFTVFSTLAHKRDETTNGHGTKTALVRKRREAGSQSSRVTTWLPLVFASSLVEDVLLAVHSKNAVFESTLPVSDVRPGYPGHDKECAIE